MLFGYQVVNFTIESLGDLIQVTDRYVFGLIITGLIIAYLVVMQTRALRKLFAGDAFSFTELLDPICNDYTPFVTK